MKRKLFWARSMEEALRSVRGTLGLDALILETQAIPEERGGGVQITALDDGFEWSEAKAGPQKQPARDDLKEVQQEIVGLKSLLCWLVPGMGQKSVLEELMAQGVSPEMIARLAERAKGARGSDDRQKIFHALTGMIPTGGDLEAEGGRLLLLGPTGVGKTTTIVKLTLRLAGQRKWRIGWVTLDTGRIAGAETMTVFAGILGVPYEMAEDKRGLKKALNRLSDCDLVLIDTAGMSPKDERTAKLAKTLEGIADLKRALLLSASTNSSDMKDWMERYRKVGFDSLIFTKVDECSHFGPMINIALGSDRPVSYLSLGQELRDSLRVAGAESLARLLMPSVETAIEDEPAAPRQAGEGKPKAEIRPFSPPVLGY